MKIALDKIYSYFKQRKLLSVLLIIFIIALIGVAIYFAVKKDVTIYINQTKTAQEDIDAQGTAVNADATVSKNKTNGSTFTNGSSSGGTNASGSSGSGGSSGSSGSTPSEPQDESPSAVVAFYADNQSDTDEEDSIHQRVVNNILSSGANPIIHLGDLMEDGSQNSLDRFNNIAGILTGSRTFYGALGNNDRKIGDPSTPSSLYLDNFSYPGNERWYSINTGNLHLVILDSAFGASDPSQVAWLASDLQSADAQSRITGVVFHHPTFVGNISQYLDDYGVDFVVSGHIHSYSHTSGNGIEYFTTTGQPSLGYMIVKIYSNVVTVYAYDNNNSLIDVVNFNKR